MCVCVGGKTGRQARIIFLCFFGVGEKVELRQMVVLRDLVSSSGAVLRGAWGYRKLVGCGHPRLPAGLVRVSALQRDPETVRR